MLLVLDRSVDMLSPVLHDFSYRSLVYEFFDVQGRHIRSEAPSSIRSAAPSRWDQSLCLALAVQMRRVCDRVGPSTHPSPLPLLLSAGRSSKYRNESGEHDRDVFLNDDDPVWCKYRHLIINEAFQSAAPIWGGLER